MRLLVQPDDGLAPLIKGINGARKRIEIVVFRADRPEIERALGNAVSRGVGVHALIAYTNRGGEKNLRKLEARLLAAGISVARTDSDLVRYHYKFLIVDRRVLYLLAFNFTYLDTHHSRSFGIATRDRRLVQEAVRLFEADTARRRYTPQYDRFVVSPLNARKRLAHFIKSAKKSLLIYDVKISDREMLRLLQDRAKAGVKIRLIGGVAHAAEILKSRRLAKLRLHTRTIIRDGEAAFVGSQSLRAIELDSRREVGVIFGQAKTIRTLTKIFEGDWKSGVRAGKPEPRPAKDHKSRKKEDAVSPAKAAKTVAKAVAEQLPPVSPVLENAVQRASGQTAGPKVHSAAVEKSIKKAVKGAIKEAIQDAIKEAVH